MASTVLKAEARWENKNCGSLDRISISIDFAQSLYPDLKGKEFAVQFSEGTGGPPSGPTDARTVSILVNEPNWHSPKKTEASSLSEQNRSASDIAIPLPVSFHFSFIDFEATEKRDVADLVCRPLEFRRDTKSKQMKQAETAINAHPEWTDAQDLKAAQQAGLRFGPTKRDAIFGIIPLKILSTFYGPLRIDRAKFSMTGIKEGNGFADLHWYIYAKETGTPWILEIRVDPFVGKIDSITEYREKH